MENEENGKKLLIHTAFETRTLTWLKTRFSIEIRIFTGLLTLVSSKASRSVSSEILILR
jgi:hypothetical protein